MKRGGLAAQDDGRMAGEHERNCPFPANSRVRTSSVPIVTIVAAFVASRVAASAAGLRFTLNFYFRQFLDFSFLSSNLLQSIYYLHSQPPLLNFLIGIGLKFFHRSYIVFFATIFASIGLLLAIAMYRLMTDLGVPPWISLVLTVLFEISPATLLFENLFYDTYPTAALLCFAAFFLNRFLRDRTCLYGTAFVVALGLPVFLNASFQIVWFVGIGGILCFFAFDRLRKILPLGVAMLGLILLLYLKNFLVFGTFTTSSASGMAISAITTCQLSPQTRAALIRAGKLSRFAAMPLFPVVHVPASARTGIPVLDEDNKPDSTAGGSNCNSLEYLTVSRADLHDAFWVIANRPEAYARGVRRAIKNYFEPASADLPYLQRTNIKRWCELYEAFLEPPGLPRLAIDPRFDQIGLNLIRSGQEAPSTVLLIALPALALFAVVSLSRAWMTRGLRDANDLTLLFIVLAILYLTPLGILVTFGENNRYRYILDPLYVVLFGLCLARGWEWLAARRHLP